MATLTRGISFRRQGSSGMSWTDNWTFTDEGMFKKQEDPAGMEHGPCLGSSNNCNINKEEARFTRSRSVGSVGSTAGTAMQIFPTLHEQMFPPLPESNSGSATPSKSQDNKHLRVQKKHRIFSLIKWLKKRLRKKP